jgi:hypothetical protein
LFFDPSSVLCSTANPTACLASIGGDLLYLDEVHLSLKGSAFLIERMVSNLRLAVR